MPADIRGSGIRTGGALQEMAVDALCESQRAMDKVCVSVDQMRESQKKGEAAVLAGNDKLDQIAVGMSRILLVLHRIAASLEAQEELVNRQEVAAHELRDELRESRGAPRRS